MKGFEVLWKGIIGWQEYAIEGETIRFRTFEDALAEVREVMLPEMQPVIRNVATGEIVPV